MKKHLTEPSEMLEQYIAGCSIEAVNLLKYFRLQAGKRMRQILKPKVRAGALRLAVNLFPQQMRTSESHYSALIQDHVRSGRRIPSATFIFVFDTKFSKATNQNILTFLEVLFN